MNCVKKYLIDFEELVYLALAFEERLFVEHLCEYAADTPYVDIEGVAEISEDELGGSIPESLYFLSVMGDGELYDSGQAEVCNFELGVADENVLGLQISMQHPRGVQVVHALHQLEQVFANSLDLLVQSRVDVLLVVHLVVAEYQEQLLLTYTIFDLQQLHHILVFQILINKYLITYLLLLLFFSSIYLYFTYKIDISRKVLLGIPSFSKSNFIFFNATIQSFSQSKHLYTSP